MPATIYFYRLNSSEASAPFAKVKIAGLERWIPHSQIKTELIKKMEIYNHMLYLTITS